MKKQINKCVEQLLTRGNCVQSLISLLAMLLDKSFSASIQMFSFENWAYSLLFSVVFIVFHHVIQQFALVSFQPCWLTSLYERVIFFDLLAHHLKDHGVWLDFCNSVLFSFLTFSFTKSMSHIKSPGNLPHTASYCLQVCLIKQQQPKEGQLVVQTPH